MSLLFPRRTNDPRVMELWNTPRENEIKWIDPFVKPFPDCGLVETTEEYNNAQYEELLLLNPGSFKLIDKNEQA